MTELNFNFKMNKKGQTGGLITSLVFGVASLVIGVIIAFVIVSTLTGSNIITTDKPSTQTVVNESFADSDTAIFTTTAALVVHFSSWNATLIMNASTDDSDNVTLVEGIDYTIFSGNGSFANLTENEDGYRVTYDYVTIDNSAILSAGNMSANFTAGVNNISLKIPTVLLIAAIVLILGVLAILVGVWQRMRMGDGAQL